MENKKLKNLKFMIGEENFEIGFGIKQVKELAKYSLSVNGHVGTKDFLKVAISEKSPTGFITDRKAQMVMDSLLDGLEQTDGDFFTFEEIIQYTLGLFSEAIDTEAKKYTPAIININKDSTVNVDVNGTEYVLKFERESIEEAFRTNSFDMKTILDMYIVGTNLVKTALQHYKTRLSVNLHDEIFLSIWATMNHEDTKDDFLELLNALVFHMNDVMQSAAKKSKAATKAIAH